MNKLKIKGDFALQKGKLKLNIYVMNNFIKV